MYLTQVIASRLHGKLQHHPWQSFADGCYDRINYAVFFYISWMHSFKVVFKQDGKCTVWPKGFWTPLLSLGKITNDCQTNDCQASHFRFIPSLFKAPLLWKDFPLDLVVWNLCSISLKWSWALMSGDEAGSTAQYWFSQRSGQRSGFCTEHSSSSAPLWPTMSLLSWLGVQRHCHAGTGLGLLNYNGTAYKIILYSCVLLALWH